MKSSYIHFHPKFLKGHDVFPFHIFVRHPESKMYRLFCAGNDPLTKPKRQKLAILLKKGAILAVQKSQRLTFIYYLDLNEDSFGERGKKAFFDDPIAQEKENNQNSATLDNSLSNLGEIPPFQTIEFTKLFNESLNNEDFLPIILKARSEIHYFSIRNSDTVSLAQLFASEFMQEDTLMNRFVALSYYFHRWLNIDEEYKLADIVCSCFLSYSGLSQFPKEKLCPFQKIDHRYSSQLLKTSEIEVTPAVLNYISILESTQFNPEQIEMVKSDITAQFLIIIKLIVEDGQLHSANNQRPIASAIDQIVKGKFNSRLHFIPSDRISRILQKILIRYEAEKAA
jgi:hypothetical protein